MDQTKPNFLALGSSRKAKLFESNCFKLSLTVETNRFKSNHTVSVYFERTPIVVRVDPTGQLVRDNRTGSRSDERF